MFTLSMIKDLMKNTNCSFPTVELAESMESDSNTGVSRNTFSAKYDSGSTGVAIIFRSFDGTSVRVSMYFYYDGGCLERFQQIFEDEDKLELFLTDRMNLIESTINIIKNTREYIRDLKGTLKTYAK